MIKEVDWGVAQLEACSPSICKTLSSIPSATKSRLVVPVISALRRQIWGWSSRGEDREFKVILGYLRPRLKNEKKKVQENKIVRRHCDERIYLVFGNLIVEEDSWHKSPKEETERRKAANSTEDKTILKGSKQTRP